MPEVLDRPLRWRKPRRVFVNSTSDLFHERVSPRQVDEVLARVLLCPQHVFQVLTKRPRRALEYFTRDDGDLLAVPRVAGDVGRLAERVHAARSRLPAEPRRWPLSNLWVGASVEDQASADERLPLLLRTPAALRWASVEPLLGPIDLSRFLGLESSEWARLDWVVVGGESGPGARPCDLRWVRRVVHDCQLAGVPVFVKQIGASPLYHSQELLSEETFGDLDRSEHGMPRFPCMVRPHLSPGGSDPREWTDDLRVREFPEAR